jgi:Uma2 family endonuclease
MATAPAIQHATGVTFPGYAGLRMSADEYLALEDDGRKYELLSGVVVMSPSPTTKHQQVLMEIAYQVKAFLKHSPLGGLYPETDIRLSADLVYRPELVFIRSERVRANWPRISEPPDLVVEIVSPESRRYDSETKRSDYERYGVREYWLIDPDLETMNFLRMEGKSYVPMQPQGDELASSVLAGFKLDLKAVRNSFQPL